MTYAIIGFGAVGQALATAFARKGIEVAVASRRPPEALAAQAAAIGPTVTPKKLEEATAAETVILAIPYSEHAEVAKTASSWAGKTVIDATNAFGIPLEEFKTSTAAGVAARLYPGARYVKGFNHIQAAKLAADPAVHGGRRVIFMAADDPDAFVLAAGLAERLGYAPVSLGTFAESGPLTSARGRSWSPLNFQDLVKFDNSVMSQSVEAEGHTA